MTDVTIFKPVEVTIRLLSPGVYGIIKPAAYTIQALNKKPPVDQTALVASLTAQVANLTAQVASLMAENASLAAQLAACLGTPKPTISNLTATPSSLPFGGGSVVIDAIVTDATALTLDGVPVTLPATRSVVASATFVLVASNASGTATASVSVSVSTLAKPTITGMTVTPSSLPVGGGDVVVDAVVTGADSITLDGVPVTLPATIRLP